MNELQIFNNPEFGQVRTIIHNGKPYFVGVDIARALGYSNPSKAVIQHCKGVTKLGIPSQGGVQETNCITEGDMYRLITHSELPAAERFESWVFDEVLPSIRQTGGYITPQAQMLQFLQGMLDEMKRQAAEIQEVKTTAKAIKDAIVEEYDEWREDIRHKVSAIQKATGETFANTWNRLYDELEKRAHCDLSIRVTNGRFRLQEAGATKKTIEAYGRLDVIEHDPRLKEIFTAIVKEYTVKYVA